MVTVNNLDSFLKEKTIFGGLSDNELDKLRQIITIREYPRKDVIFLEEDPGDSFYLVLSGEIRIYKISSDGREKTLALIGEGDFFGEMALIDQKCRSANAETLVKSKLAIVYREHFLALIHQHPEIAIKIIIQLADRLRGANLQIESLVFQDVRERLIHFLGQYASTVDATEPVPLQKNFTHLQIANLIGTTRETVTRILGDLQEEGQIMTKGRKIYINDLKSGKDYGS